MSSGTGLNTVDAMNRIVDDLKAHLRDAQSVFDSGTTIGTALGADEKRIQDLAGRLMTDVIEGRLSFEKWKAIAELTWKDISYQAKLKGESGIPAFWDQVVAETAVTVAKGVESAAAAVKENFSPILLVVGLVAVAVIVFKVA